MCVSHPSCRSPGHPGRKDTGQSVQPSSRNSALLASSVSLWCELSPAGFDRSLRHSVTGSGDALALPSPPQPLGSPSREEERRLSCGVGERMGSRGRGQRSHTSSNMPGVPIACQSQTQTHIPEGPSLQALRRSTPISFLVIPSQRVPQSPALPTGKELLPDATGPSFVHSTFLTLVLGTGVREMEARTITPSSTFSSPLPGTTQRIRSPPSHSE